MDGDVPTEEESSRASFFAELMCTLRSAPVLVALVALVIVVLIALLAPFLGTTDLLAIAPGERLRRIRAPIGWVRMPSVATCIHAALAGANFTFGRDSRRTL